MNHRFLRKAKMATLAALMAGGTMLGSACTLEDLRDNVVAGSLLYVKGEATSFWDTVIPVDWDNVFNNAG